MLSPRNHRRSPHATAGLWVAAGLVVGLAAATGLGLHLGVQSPLQGLTDTTLDQTPSLRADGGAGASRAQSEAPPNGAVAASAIPPALGAELSGGRRNTEWTPKLDWFEANTGPRIQLDETSMRRLEGRLNVREQGKVLDGVVLEGSLYVLASDVTIRGSIINGSVTFAQDASNGRLVDTIVRARSPYPVRASDGAEGIVVEHCEIDGRQFSKNNGGVYGGNINVRHCELHGHTDSAKVESNSVWEYNYLHSNGRWGSDAHVDGFQSNGGRSIVLRRNWVDMEDQNSAIILGATFGHVDDVLIEENYLNGGNYVVYVRTEGEYPAPTNVRIRNNHFGPDHRYGLFSVDGDGVDRTGNVWAVDEEPISK